MLKLFILYVKSTWYQNNSRIGLIYLKSLHALNWVLYNQFLRFNQKMFSAYKVFVFIYKHWFWKFSFFLFSKTILYIILIKSLINPWKHKHELSVFWHKSTWKINRLYINTMAVDIVLVILDSILVCLEMWYSHNLEI